jgi:uncharacterized protein
LLHVVTKKGKGYAPAEQSADKYHGMRAVVFSALTTATAFGALWLSSHPGTASMGRLLMISLGCELLVTLLFRPALLGRPPEK